MTTRHELAYVMIIRGSVAFDPNDREQMRAAHDRVHAIKAELERYGAVTISRVQSRGRRIGEPTSVVGTPIEKAIVAVSNAGPPGAADAPIDRLRAPAHELDPPASLDRRSELESARPKR